mmetsp:Transcript_14594/g.44109  ORF Transcript_14594/g.44109 Transcript_14594/m.44109 type:complete len:360 (+) Transcript_14594:296-1375(+)
MGKSSRDELDLLHVGFNQDYGCFACGTATGFRVYNCDPFRETFRRELDKGGIGIVEMLFRCNILAIVGSGTSAQYPPNKVMIWDDHQGRCIGELSFRSQVHSVRLRRDRICVALEHKVLVYNFADLRLLHSIETLSNPGGILALSAAAEQTILACPGLHVGQVRMELYDVRRTKFIQAHSSGLAALSLSLNGRLLATASDRGTLVRIYSTADGSKLQELRRGADPARIFSIAFAKGDSPEWLAMSSDKGTVHVFKLATAGADTRAAAAVRLAQTDGNANPVSALSFVSNILPVPYFASERSFAQFRLSEEVRSVVGFGSSPATIVVASASGVFYTAGFNAQKGGMCEQRSFCRFLEASD